MYDAIRELGAELVAISPQTKDKNAEVKAKHRLQYRVLSDVGNLYAKRLELTFQLPADLRALYEQFGIDLPAHNGDESWELPMPTRLVVDAEGVIQAVDADPDYTVRPEPEATLDVLQDIT